MDSKYTVYRHMSEDEYINIEKKGLEILDNSNTCPLKCITESIVKICRFNPKVQVHKNIIAEIKFQPEFRKVLQKKSIFLKSEPFGHADNYGKYRSIKNNTYAYRSHGIGIDLYNYEICKQDLIIVNNNITSVKQKTIEDLNSEVEHLFLKNSLPSDQSDLDYNELYVQLPFDFGALALEYKQIPKGGLNNHIKYRYLSKDSELLDSINYEILPLTLIVKVSNNYLMHLNSKYKSTPLLAPISSNDLPLLNTHVLDLKLASCKRERSGYKYASKVLNKNFEN